LQGKVLLNFYDSFSGKMRLDLLPVKTRSIVKESGLKGSDWRDNVTNISQI
jgi:hypothetical protein